MSEFIDIKIIGIDKDRPPRIRKEAYIDLFFRLSAKGSIEWCEDFNALGRKINPSPKVDKNTGECIQTYVSNMALIAPHLADVKEVLRNCNQQHQQKIEEKARVLAASNATLQGQDGEQHKLNQVIEGLNFDN